MENRSLQVCVSIIVLLGSIGIAWALPSITPTSFSANTSAASLYNITITNTESGSANITLVSITLPAGFSFSSGSEGTSAVSTAFSSSFNTLSWSNSTFVVQNSATQHFWFNAAPNSSYVGTHNISISLTNSTATTNYTLPANVNDATLPIVSFVSPSIVNGTNTTATTISVNFSATDNVQVSSVLVTLYNSASTAVSSAILIGSSLNHTFTVNEGNYTVNATVNDSYNNRAFSETRKIVVDRTEPAISAITLSSNTDDSITVAYNCSDSGSGIKSCAISDSEAGDIAGNMINDLECSKSYWVEVTARDHAGNNETKTSSEFATDGCDDEDDSSGGGGADTTNSNATWTATYSIGDSEFKEGYTKELSVKQRIRFKVGNDQHTVGVISLTSSKATINVSSKPQQAIFAIGDEKKFDVDTDGFYDIKVILNSISSNKANVSVIAISEESEEKEITASASTSNIPKKTINTSITDSSQDVQENPGIQFGLITEKYYGIGIAAVVLGAIIVICIIGWERRWLDKMRFIKHSRMAGKRMRR